jgi:hypothetical protein
MVVLLLKIFGNKLSRHGGMCTTMNTLPRNGDGNAERIRRTTCTPPAEAPITTMSRVGLLGVTSWGYLDPPVRPR